MADSGTFTKGGRTWVYETSPQGNTKGIYYETNLQEATRVKDKFGEQFTGTKDGKYYVLLSGYQKQPDGTWRYGPYPPGTETANGNATQVQTIGADTGLKQQITGSVTNNNPTNPNQPGTPGGSTPTSDPNQPKKQEAQLLTYPSYIKPDQDRIKFQACEINPRGGSLINTPQYTKVGSPVFMAIQAPISDQNSVDWGPDTVNAIDNFVYKTSYNIIKTGDPQLPTSQQIIRELDKNTNYIQKFLAGQAASLNNVLARTDNIVLNPNLELLFQGPQLRPFSFQFKMSARDEDEAKQVRAIIRYFKENMAVRKESGLFLKAPYVFTIQYLKGTTPHKSINRISKSDIEKACALTNCSVDYTPLGSYMTYEDDARTMVSYTLSLQFQELTPVYADDYKDISEDAIGY